MEQEQFVRGVIELIRDYEEAGNILRKEKLSVSGREIGPIVQREDIPVLMSLVANKFGIAEVSMGRPAPMSPQEFAKKIFFHTPELH